MTNGQKKPVVLYDGECNFCKKWVKEMRKTTGETVDYIPYQEGCNVYKEVSREACQLAVQLIDEEKHVHSGMEVLYWLLYRSNRYRWLYKLYLKSGLFRCFSNAVYHWVMKNRR